MTIAPLPHQYVVSYADGQLSAQPRSPIRAGAPPQFGGSDTVWSPEELLVGAAMLCLQTTFAALARRSALPAHDWRATATGTLDKSPTGPVFTAIRIDVDIATEAGSEERVAALLRTAERQCIISRALTAPVEITVTVRAAERLPAAG